MYTIIIKDLKGKQLLDLIDRLPKSTTIEVSNSGEESLITTAVNRTSMNGATCLTMTGKSATQGSMRHQVLTAFEKLEKKHKIGNVSRDMLREYCNDKDLDSQIIYQLIRDGYLKAL